MNASQPKSQRKRPIAVTFVGLVAVLAAVFYAALGIMDIINSGYLQAARFTALLDFVHMDAATERFVGGVYLVISALAALIISWGAFRMKRWAWIAFMAWCIVLLVLQILRYYIGAPNYLTMAIAAFVVLALNQSEVQIAFGIKRTENVQLESATNNPLDRE